MIALFVSVIKRFNKFYSGPTRKKHVDSSMSSKSDSHNSVKKINLLHKLRVIFYAY